MANALFDHRLCEIQPGDVVCDPMAGGGSIPIEVLKTFVLCQKKLMFVN